MESESLKTWHYLVAAGLLALGALAVLEVNGSPFLPGAHADSVEYMEAGRALAAGEGLEVPIASWASPDSVAPLSHFPPGLPVAIAAAIRTTQVRPYVAALWVIALAAGATLGLTFLIVAPIQGWGLSLLTVALIAILPPFAMVHTTIWSEPLYLPLLLVTLAFMIRWPERPLPAGCAAALAVMVRYIGLATVVAVGVWVLWKTRSWRKALLGMAPGVLAFSGWWTWTKSLGGAVRTPGEFDVALTSTLGQLPETLRFWLAPGLPLAVAFIFLLLLVVTHLVGRPRLGIPVALLMAAHVGVIVVARLLVDQRIPFDTRVLLPVLILALLPIGSSLRRWPRTGALLLVAWGAWVVQEDATGIRSLQQTGQYYSSGEWLTSDLIDWVDNRSAGLRLYSNEPGLMVYQSQRYARLLPLRTESLDDFARVWNERPGAIVLVAPMRQDERPPDEYLQRLPVRLELDVSNALVLVPSRRGGEGVTPKGP